MKRQLRILLLEDSRDDVALIQWELDRAGIAYTSLVVHDEGPFINALVSFRPDVVLADHTLPRFSSVEAFRMFQAYSKAFRRSIPFILVTGDVAIEFAAGFLSAGVDDFISKDNLKKLPKAVEMAIERHRVVADRRNDSPKLYSEVRGWG